MRIRSLGPAEWAKAVGLGVVTAILLSLVMVPTFLFGVSPLPEPPSLAFAKALLGPDVPLPVGLLFHVAYVTLWVIVYIAVFRDGLTFLRALGLGLALWVVALVVFFPIVGWGFLGLAIGPKLIVAALVPHLLFSVFTWGLARLAFRPRSARSAA